MEQDRAGQQLGYYRLTHSLGSGGFATVYEGEHTALKNYRAAIKVIKETALTDRARDNFLREANTIRQLIHPHIVRVLECGVEVKSHGSIPYIVMSLAEKGNVRKLYPKGEQLPLRVIQSYIKQTAEALHFAHSKGFVHCDIKPENMLVNALDEILLSDFGIADISHTADISVLEKENPVYSKMLMGTVSYMAPERFKHQIRRSSDQYSLGVVTYEWLVGERPFIGSEEQITVQQLQSPPPPIRPRRPEVTPELENVVMKALAKEPEERFPTVKDFAQALERAIQAILAKQHPGQPVLAVSGHGNAPIIPQEVKPVPKPATASPPPARQSLPTQTPVLAQRQTEPDSPLKPQPWPVPAQKQTEPEADRFPTEPAANQKQANADISMEQDEQDDMPTQPASFQSAPDLIPTRPVSATPVFSKTPFQLEPVELQAPDPSPQIIHKLAAPQQRPRGSSFAGLNDPAMSTTINVRLPEQAIQEGGFAEFTELFTVPTKVLRHWFALDAEFDRLREFRNFRTFGKLLNVLSAIGMGVLFHSWMVFLLCLCSLLAFLGCIHLVNRFLAILLGILLALYWAGIGLVLANQLPHIPFLTILPSPDLIAIVFFVVSAWLHINYVLRRVS
ncbi:hypothetical protein EPA93_34380 [Ktedonosporobacter rubrisoli]|uniref:non-specific serine/threonine protein kinase n=1 Tax=Ktedonosporobacter rubrisoli TaxID=2509675 RepID=A0A4P6JZ63_KTERU|nr:serine/threonine-protein kinase [Ktedonosporobacter rubrisoli]QBD80783.1 hypothetical protein EPA93_34380 [Ktedonosporobacter rubrisoli]